MYDRVMHAHTYYVYTVGIIIMYNTSSTFISTGQSGLAKKIVLLNGCVLQVSLLCLTIGRNLHNVNLAYINSDQSGSTSMARKIQKIPVYIRTSDWLQ